MIHVFIIGFVQASKLLQFMQLDLPKWGHEGHKPMSLQSLKGKTSPTF